VLARYRRLGSGLSFCLLVAADHPHLCLEGRVDVAEILVGLVAKKFSTVLHQLDPREFCIEHTSMTEKATRGAYQIYFRHPASFDFISEMPYIQKLEISR